MYKEIKYKDVRVTFGFRHRWDEKAKSRESYNREFKNNELGVWFRRSKIVNKKFFKDFKNWGSNTVSDYTFGVKLIVCHFWVGYVKY